VGLGLLLYVAFISCFGGNLDGIPFMG
jgi:hypothetical protein